MCFNEYIYSLMNVYCLSASWRQLFIHNIDWILNRSLDWISLVQSLSHVRLSATPCTAARQASLSIINSRSLPKLMTIESVMPSSHLILCHLLLLLPSIFPSIRVFLLSKQFSNMQYNIINYSHHALHYISMAYLIIESLYIWHHFMHQILTD